MFPTTVSYWRTGQRLFRSFRSKKIKARSNADLC
ncbi:unnamed protein product [Brassica oleracea]